MRRIKSSDAFAFIRLLKKLEVKEELKELALKSQSIKDLKEGAAAVWDNGFELIYNIMDRATEKGGEDEIFKFLAPIAEKTEDELRDLELKDFIDLIKQIIEENDIASFFKSALSLMK